MHVVTMLNLKGGVGKTSSTHHISGALAIAHGLRVLAIDNDPQASLTQGWWGQVATDALDPARTINSVLAGELPPPSRVIYETGVPGLSLLPGSPEIEDFNTPRASTLPRERKEAIREFLEDVRGDFDVVLIDCPPNLYGCSYAALAASDWIVIPVEPEDYGAQGIAKVLGALESVQGDGYPVDLLGYVLTKVNTKRTLHRAYEERLRAIYGPMVFGARLPLLPDISEATSSRKVVHMHKPKGAAAKAVKAVADEILSRATAAKSSEGVAA